MPSVKVCPLLQFFSFRIISEVVPVSIHIKHKVLILLLLLLFTGERDQRKRKLSGKILDLCQCSGHFVKVIFTCPWCLRNIQLNLFKRRIAVLAKARYFCYC